MGIWQSFVGKLAGSTINSLVDLKLKEAQSAAAIMAEDVGWTRLGGGSRRDITPIKHELMLKLAQDAYDTNPLGKWILQMTRDLICAEGITVSSDDDQVSDLLTDFWQHPINNMDLNLPQMVLELGLWGEQCWPVFAGDAGGVMSLGLVDSSDILRVDHDPDNCAVPIGVVLKDRGEHEGKKLRIIYDKPDEDLFASAALTMRAEQFTDGETFWSKVNTVRSATRGASDVYHLIDWLDGYEKFLIYSLERAAHLNAYTWDVTLDGMDQTQVAEWLRKNPKPDPGSWFAHNDSVHLQAVTPNMGAADAAEHGRMIRNHVLGAASYPEHWFGGGGDVNRATAEAMGLPTFKHYQERQRFVRYQIYRVCTHQLKLARDGGRLSRDTFEFDVNMPQMVTADLSGIMTALSSLSNAAAVAEDRGWIDAGVSQRLFATLTARMGVEIPVDELQARAEAHSTPDYRSNAAPGVPS